jgi:hypothetical protein
LCIGLFFVWWWWSECGEICLLLVLEVLALDQLGNVLIVRLVLLVLVTLLLLQALVALGELAERGQGVGAKLVEDTGDELGKLLVLAVSVDSEGVGGDGGVNWERKLVYIQRGPKPAPSRCVDNAPLGAAKWMTFPSSLNMLTSSMAWMGWTFSFLSAVWSFLSSVPALLCTFLTFLRGVPFPLHHLSN